MNAVGEASSQQRSPYSYVRSSILGTACPPQWLPLLLALYMPSSPQSLPPPAPPPTVAAFALSPPFECVDIPLVSGWQMVSFNCIGPASSSFSVLDSAPFQLDDTIQTREGGLVIATYDGTKWRGALVSQGFSYAKGYKVFFSGASGSAIKQSGATQLPVEDTVLSIGWNWIGYASFSSCNINSGITVVDGQFTTDDQIKTRSGGRASFTSYTGSKWAGGLSEFEPGAGYEVHVDEAVTFRCSQPPPSLPSPPPPLPPSPPRDFWDTHDTSQNCSPLAEGTYMQPSPNPNGQGSVQNCKKSCDEQALDGATTLACDSFVIVSGSRCYYKVTPSDLRLASGSAFGCGVAFFGKSFWWRNPLPSTPASPPPPMAPPQGLLDGAPACVVGPSVHSHVAGGTQLTQCDSITVSGTLTFGDNVYVRTSRRLALTLTLTLTLTL